MINVGQLHVQSSFKIQRIEDVQIEWKPNEHGRMILRGIVADTDQMNSAIHAAVDDPIMLQAITEEREVRLFKGVIASVKTTSRNGVFTVKLEAISGTIKLDRTIHNRSFQDKGMSYESLIQQVIAPYQGNDVLVGVGENESIGAPVYQYGETDWTLLKRLASQLNSVVYCDLYESAPRVYFGFPEGRSYTIPNETSYTASKNMKAYHQSMMNGDNLSSSEFFSYEIETDEKYAIGDRVTFRNKQLVISEAGARMVGGQLRFTYRLSRIAGVRGEQLRNHKLTGLSLSGKVLAVKGELVQLHLDIDKEQSSSKANWYPFAPPTGNVMYCMPQVGAHASLYLPDATGDKAMVIGSVRLNGEACAKTGDPNNRYLGTEHGSELELTPSAMNLTGAGPSPLKVTLEDATGIRITSPSRLTLDAMQEISIYTPKKVNIKAESMLVVKKRDAASGVTVEGEYHVLGSTVEANGSDRESFAPYDDEPKEGEPPPPPPPKKFSWGKLLGNVVAGLAVVAVVAVAAAFTVATLGAGGVVVGAVLAGGLVAGAIGVGAKAISDIARGEVSSMGSYMLAGAREAFIGALTGAVFGPLGVAGTFAARMAMEGVQGAFGSVVSQLLTDGKVNWKTVMVEAGISAAFGGLLSKEVLGAIGSKIKGVVSWLNKGQLSAFVKYVHVMENLKDAVSRGLSSVGKSIKNGFDNVVKQLNDLSAGASNLKNKVSQGLSDVGKNVKNGVNIALDNVQVPYQVKILTMTTGHKVVAFETKSLREILEEGKARKIDSSSEGTGNVPESIPTLKKVDWNEYKRVDDYKPTFMDEFQEKEYKAASKDYDDIRSVGMTDIEQVAKNTGMIIEEIRAMKQHMFFDTHNIPLDNQSYRVGHFTPDLEVGFIWKEAQKGELDPKQKKWFQELAKHELTESEKMKQGYPYKNPGSYQKDSDDFGSDPPGAHDVASDQPSFELPGAYDYYSKKVFGQ